ncbi:hypothetical protein [Streptomyces sp. NBC_00233]|uniref:hypothetical protein n=1 Tax=Streptomyces sp. NBC_00233 TaxID=2975686 RepID=UPI00224DE66B|nr:hypothetical protein [Streptomyces sp. NBC_00233]MCX5232935.1 hypothetical protein [Streptomyces sp. NBC_00233]
MSFDTSRMTCELDADFTQFGLDRLLSYWGGEAIYWRHCQGNPALAGKLRSLGTPMIVTALLDLSALGPEEHGVFPPMINVLVGKELGHEPASADVLYRAPIPPTQIESIVSPGDPDYDRFPELPRI